MVVDVRDEENVKKALDATAQHFGGIDIVVNNASAIQLTNSQQTDMNRFDLMHQINTRGTFMVSKHAIPHLVKAREPAHPDALAAARHEGEMVRGAHRLLDGEVWHEPGGAGPCGRTASGKVAVNALWPRTVIATSAVNNLLGGDALMRMSRTTDILADAAYAIFNKPKTFTGNFLIDDTFLSRRGRHRFRQIPRRPDAAAADRLLRTR